jgi:hypothetical protein
MSKLLKDNSAFLHLLMSPDTPKAQVRAILNTVSTRQLNTLTEICYNLLKGNIPISTPHKKPLKRFAPGFRVLGKAKESIKSRKACLQPALVIALLNAVSPILKSVGKDAVGR